MVNQRKTLKLPGPVLLVDDDPFVREVVAAALMPAGVAVRACGSGEEALGVVGDLKPALVILDSRLPGDDGLAVWKGLCARFSDSALLPAAIFLTARPTPELASAPGVAGVISKPFNPATLLADLCHLLTGDTAAAPGRPERLAAITAEFRLTLPALVIEIEGYGSALGAGWQRHAAETLLTKAHGLAGRAGLFGFHGVGTAAEKVERVLLNSLNLNRAPTVAEEEALAASVSALVAACRAG